MRPEDIDLEFPPEAKVLPRERHEWTHIIAGALVAETGSATAIFRKAGEEWALEAFLWFQPGAWFLKAASREKTEPLRTRVVEALRAAGKNVRA
ncbi:MAG TPA: hypothetical protein VEQ10_06390 [Vicinamibacteria bacterium]|nr:hypothetical protein [Vicinamibacteria bacterium]